MKIEAEIPIAELNILPKITRDFVRMGEEFDFGRSFDLKRIPEALSQINFPDEIRVTLVRSLKKQYQEAEITSPALIDTLGQPDTFTVTTGHQLCLFTGPLYLVYKIASAINLANRLKSEYPNKNFVPVFWMATEDHDFEEASVLNLFGKELKWKNEETGAVGRMTTDSLVDPLNELKEILGDKGTDFYQLLARSLEQKTVAQQFRVMIHGLFGDGLVILDADRRELKSCFTEIAIKDLNGVPMQALNVSNEKIAKEYPLQVTGRDVNLFWLNENSRKRIIPVNGSYRFGENGPLHSRAEVEQLFRENPEKVSPNVVLRPVYQQVILPNLIYIGGGGELAYWLQLKQVFTELDVHYPMVQLRSGMVFLRDKWLAKWQEFEFSFSQLFEDPDSLKRQLVLDRGDVEIKDESREIQVLFKQIKNKIITIDRSLEGMVGAEARKVEKSLENIEKRLVRALKNRSEQELARIDKILAMVKPDGVFQERYNSIFDVFSSPGEVKQLIDVADPTTNNLRLLSY